MPGFLWSLPHAPFPFADSNLHPFITIKGNISLTASEFWDSFYISSSLKVVLEIPDSIILDNKTFLEMSSCGNKFNKCRIPG